MSTQKNNVFVKMSTQKREGFVKMSTQKSIVEFIEYGYFRKHHFHLI